MTWHDVMSGEVNLAELAEINNYLDMIDDVRYFAEKDLMNKHKPKGRWR